jgi:hypothetical protein
MRIGAIVIHTPKFDRTVAFWQAALGYVPRERAEADWVVLCDPTRSNPNLAFHARDRHPPSRSWVHLDLYALAQETEVQRLLKLGARRYRWRYPRECDFVVLEDPGGNLFRVVAKPNDRLLPVRTQSERPLTSNFRVRQHWPLLGPQPAVRPVKQKAAAKHK